MTCIDCLYCEICDYWYDAAYSTEPEEWDGQVCKYFKNKSNFIELPCVIGQPVWKLFTWPSHPAEILDGRVSMIQQKADRSWKIRISTKYGTDDLKAEDLGKWVFLNKEAAEEALAKREATVDGYC